MSTKVNIRPTKSYKPSTEVYNTFNKQKDLLSGNLMQPRKKLKFGRPKFEHFDHARPNQDLTAEIQSK